MCKGQKAEETCKEKRKSLARASREDIKGLIKEAVRELLEEERRASRGEPRYPPIQRAPWQFEMPEL
jgi:hypothetical protein